MRIAIALTAGVLIGIQLMVLLIFVKYYGVEWDVIKALLAGAMSVVV